MLDAALANFFGFDPTQVSRAAAVVNPTYHHHQQLTQTGDPLIGPTDYCVRTVCLQPIIFTIVTWSFLPNKGSIDLRIS